MTQAYISIGSNIDPRENITRAKGELNKLFTCMYSDNF